MYELQRLFRQSFDKNRNNGSIYGYCKGRVLGFWVQDTFFDG